MSYLVLARKYRPLVFGDLVAQDHVTRTLVNAIASGRISHAYLFAGPRGVGKTSSARILARAVNCRETANQDPCNQCVSCREIIQGHSLDVLEIDGASNRGIDEIRDLRVRVGYAPSSSRYKVYIIDEVHMLTQEAFNALLKTLEEPPSHVIFIFATTAPHKVPPTILSRCQRFDFKSVPTDRIVAQLEKVFAAEEIRMNPEVVSLIARKADGAMRDALSLSDQVIAFCAGDYTVEKAAQVLGILDAGLFFSLSELVSRRDTQGVIAFVERLADSGVDLEEFYSELARHYRNKIIFKLGTREPAALDIPAAQAERYRESAGNFELDDLVRALQLILQFEQIIKLSGQQRISLELLLIRLTLLEKSVNISALIDRLEGSPEVSVGAPGKTAQASAEERERKPYSAPAGKPPEAEGEPALRATRMNPPAEYPAAQVERPLSEAGAEKEISLAAIKEHWPRLISKVRQVNASLSAVLSTSQPERFENGTLVLTIHNGSPYNLERLRQEDSRKIICDALKAGLGLDSIRLESVPLAEKKVEQPGTAEMTANPASRSFEQLCRTNPVMGKIKELFNPELIS